MKVIILAGGHGSRLGSFSETLPKPMVQIGGYPILWHIMKYYAHYGFNEFVIPLGVKGNVIKEYFYNFNILNRDFTVDLDKSIINYENTSSNHVNWKVTLVDTGFNTLKGGRIKRVEKYLKDKTNMMTYGDGLSDVNLLKLYNFHRKHKKILTITGVKSPLLFGTIQTKYGLVTHFAEKKESCNLPYINGGFMVFDQKLFDFLNPSENCDFEYAPMERLVSQGEVMLYKHDGSWECMDHERDVIKLNNLWSNKQAFWKLWK